MNFSCIQVKLALIGMLYKAWGPLHILRGHFLPAKLDRLVYSGPLCLSYLTIPVTFFFFLCQLRTLGLLHIIMYFSSLYMALTLRWFFVNRMRGGLGARICIRKFPSPRCSEPLCLGYNYKLTSILNGNIPDKAAD